jgi:hypothetical protein
VNGQATGPSDAVIAIAPGSPVEMTVELAHVTAASNTVDTFLYGKAAPRTVVWTTTVTATNILLSGFAYGFAAEEEQSGVTIVTDDHTLYHDVTTQTLAIAGSPSLTTLNPVSGDPKLAGDFHLTAGSVAIDAGLDIGVLVDLDGEARPNGSLPDIGADEFYWRYIYLPVIIR